MYLPILIAVAALGSVYYFANTKKTKTPVNPGNSGNSGGSGSGSSGTANTTATFPLVYGQTNEYVRKLQNALIAIYGKNVLPVYGPDGNFGGETKAALKEKYGIESVSQSKYNSILADAGDYATENKQVDAYKKLDAKKLATQVKTELRGELFSDYLGVRALSELTSAQIKAVANEYKNISTYDLLTDLKGIFWKNDFIKSLITKLQTNADGENKTPGFLERWLGTIQTDNSVNLVIRPEVFAGLAIAVILIILVIRVTKPKPVTS